MSSSKPPKKKKVVVTTQASSRSAGSSQATSTRTRASKEPVHLTFGKTNFLWMSAGAVLVALGLLLMTGGQMPDPNTWDDSIIYSTRRTLIAPIVILAGLAVEIYAIFVKEKPAA